MTNKKLTFSINGMKCGNCVKKIQDSFNELDFKLEASFDLEKKEISVTFDQNEGQGIQIKKQIEEAGFNVNKMG
ncbi:MAG: heavy-metal-associated domain-containing protein [Bdellovibrionota bacterium]|nr:heavy-metal-associated domain-containing protein [Bdellovibrionota bacterium]